MHSSLAYSRSGPWSITAMNRLVAAAVASDFRQPSKGRCCSSGCVEHSSARIRLQPRTAAAARMSGCVLTSSPGDTNKITAPGLVRLHAGETGIQVIRKATPPGQGGRSPTVVSRRQETKNASIMWLAQITNASYYGSLTTSVRNLI